MGGIRGFFGFKPVSSNNIDNPPPRPPSGGGGAVASLGRGDGNGKSNVKLGDFGKGASPAPTRTMRKG